MTREQKIVAYKNAIEKKESELENWKKRLAYDKQHLPKTEAELDKSFIAWTIEELNTLNESYLNFLLQA